VGAAAGGAGGAVIGKVIDEPTPRTGGGDYKRKHKHGKGHYKNRHKGHDD